MSRAHRFLDPESYEARAELEAAKNSCTDLALGLVEARAEVACLQERLTLSEGRLETAVEEVERLRKGLAFARSVIQSGERWSDECERLTALTPAQPAEPGEEG